MQICTLCLHKQRPSSQQVSQDSPKPLLGGRQPDRASLCVRVGPFMLHIGHCMAGARQPGSSPGCLRLVQGVCVAVSILATLAEGLGLAMR